MKNEVLSRLALIQIPGVGDLFAKLLTEYFSGAAGLFQASKKELSLIPGIGKVLLHNLTDQHIKKTVFKRAEIELEFVKKNNISILLYDGDEYPERLKMCDDGPYLLFKKGAADISCSKVVSIVGTRKATGYGEDLTQKIINDFKNEKILIVSGLAYGIDTFAHQSSLRNSLPTIGVLAHGLDRVYPSKNKGLAKNMIENGALVTEFFSQTNPDRENFPKRNRIVAGISEATIVIEATVKGGALITAKIAHSYGRDVFAIPGRSIDYYSQGCNWLIKTQWATLIENGIDVLRSLNWETPVEKQEVKQAQLFTSLVPEEEKILSIIKVKGAVTKEFLAHHLEIKIQHIAGFLFNLELSGLIKSLPGDLYQMKG